MNTIPRTGRKYVPIARESIAKKGVIVTVIGSLKKNFGT